MDMGDGDEIKGSLPYVHQGGMGRESKRGFLPYRSARESREKGVLIIQLCKHD